MKLKSFNLLQTPLCKRKKLQGFLASKRQKEKATLYHLETRDGIFPKKPKKDVKKTEGFKVTDSINIKTGTKVNRFVKNLPSSLNRSIFRQKIRDKKETLLSLR